MRNMRVNLSGLATLVTQKSLYVAQISKLGGVQTPSITTVLVPNFSV